MDRLGLDARCEMREDTKKSPRQCTEGDQYQWCVCASRLCNELRLLAAGPGARLSFSVPSIKLTFQTRARGLGALKWTVPGLYCKLNQNYSTTLRCCRTSSSAFRISAFFATPLRFSFLAFFLLSSSSRLRIFTSKAATEGREKSFLVFFISE
jgi:hypothetical protein